MADAPTERVLVPPLREDLLTDAARRLMWIAMLVAVVGAIGLVVTIVELTTSPRPHSWIRFATGAWVVALSGTVAHGMRRTKLRVGQMRWAATGFLFVLAASSATLRHLVSEGESTIGMIPGIAVAIMLFPVVVPGSPRRAALNGVMATATDIGIYALLVTLEVRAAVEPLDAVGLFRGEIIAIGVAYGIAHIVVSLEDRVVQARQLGAYTLHDELGKGGMGEVWTATHAHLRRPAAVKLIRPEVFAGRDPLARGAMVERFEREAQATAELLSPHTIDVYDYGVADDGTLYYVMELLRGLDVQELVAQDGPLPAERAVYLLRQVCHSLAEAHARGMVHRDIKPANVFVCGYGREVDFVKVLDFGLVRVATAEQRGLTVAGAITGTPAFMAPEQAVDGRAVDARADVYAVGALACFMLTGRTLFGNRSPAAYLAALKTKPVPPLAELGIAGPPGLVSLLQACLARDLDRRPETMDTVEARLGEIAAELPRWPPRV